VFAQTFYVDPASGANTNSGTGPASAWRNPPGARNSGDSGFASTTWGSISQSAKVPCGSTILLLGGRTYTSSQGGAWRIDPTYYPTSCTASARIAIRVATASEWSGSTGPFTFDGSGITSTCMNFCGGGGVAALIDVEGVNFITVGGVSATQRLIVKNGGSGAGGAMGQGIAVTNGYNPQASGFRGQWLELANNAGAGIDVSRWKNWIVTNSIAHDNRGPGFAIGQQNDHTVNNGAYVDATAYNNAISEFPGYADAFFFVGGIQMWCVRCTAYSNWQRGYNTGQLNGTYNMSYHFRDMRSWNNGLTSNNNIAKAGFGFSGDDLVGGALQQNFVVGALIYRNPFAGGWLGYGNGWVEMWNATLYGNGWANGGGDLEYDRSSDQAAVFNSILQKRSYNNIWSWNNANIITDHAPVSNYNIYRPVSADTEAVATFNYQSGGFSSAGRTFAAASAGQMGFFGANDLVGLRYDPHFTAPNDTNYSTADFTIGAGSAALDSGQFLMRASSAGTNATTVNVLGNGLSNDPRNYFISSTSYLDAAPDRIQIQGCGQVTITSMTATSISFSPACSWASGAGVHLPWSGSRPDRGAFESGAAAPAPPTNLRVIP
jgi:hypothetical protein